MTDFEVNSLQRLNFSITTVILKVKNENFKQLLINLGALKIKIYILTSKAFGIYHFLMNKKVTYIYIYNNFIKFKCWLEVLIYRYKT